MIRLFLINQDKVGPIRRIGIIFGGLHTINGEIERIIFITRLEQMIIEQTHEKGSRFVIYIIESN